MQLIFKAIFKQKKEWREVSSDLIMQGMCVHVCVCVYVYNEDVGVSQRWQELLPVDRLV